MKSNARIQFHGLIDGFLQLTVIDDGFKHHVKVTPRKMLGSVAQLNKIDDKQVRTVEVPINETMTSFMIGRGEAHQLALEISDLMKWN